MPKMGSGVRTSRGKRREALGRVASELSAAAEKYGYFQTDQHLSELRLVAARAARAGMDASAMSRTTESAVARGEARREAERAAEAAAALPVEVVAPAPAEKKRSRKKAMPEKPSGRMISSPFYPEQPCGLSYKDFRVGHTYKDAYHWLMTAPKDDTTYRTITQRAVLRQLARMKRQTYEQYLSDCAAQEQYEIEQAHGGREGEYATDDSGDFDVSFDPSEFAPAEPDDFIAFNPRRGIGARTVVYHGTSRHQWERTHGGRSRLYVTDRRADADEYAYSAAARDEEDGLDPEPQPRPLRRRGPLHERSTDLQAAQEGDVQKKRTALKKVVARRLG